MLQGTDGPDNLTGFDSDDVIVGKKGDDFLFGLGGADLFPIYAGHGSLSFSIDDATGGGDGADVIDGGSGSDTFQVTTDFLVYLHGSNSDFSPMHYDLSAGSGGAALFTRSQTWFNSASGAGGSLQSTVT